MGILEIMKGKIVKKCKRACEWATRLMGTEGPSMNGLRNLKPNQAQEARELGSPSTCERLIFDI